MSPRPCRNRPVLPRDSAKREAPHTPAGDTATNRACRAAARRRRRARAWLLTAALLATALGAREAAAAITPSPGSVSIYPTQTSGLITLTMTYTSAPTWSGTNTIAFTMAGIPLPSWLTTVPSPVTYSWVAGALSSTTSFRFQASSAAVVGTYLLTMNSAGGTPPPGVGSGTVTLQILQPSYTASASPNPVSIPWGGSRAVTVATTVDPGYNTSIVYSFTGFPAGISWGTAQAVMPPSYPAATFTFSVVAGTAPGTYAGNLAASGMTNKTFPMTVIVPSPDVTASLAQPTMTVCNGGPPVSNSVTLTAVNGYQGSPQVDFISVPAGLTMNPGTLSVPSMPPSRTVSFTVTASGASAGANVVTLRITDAVAALNKTVQLTVNVPVPDYTPAASPSALTLNAGGASQGLMASITPNGCFSAPSVTVTPSGAPPGVTFTPPVATLSAPQYGSTLFTVQAASSAAAGTYPITLTFGQIGSAAKTVPVTLTVVAAPDFALAVTPPALSLAPGASSSVTVSLTGINGFSSVVSVTAPTRAGVTYTPASFLLSPGGTQAVTIAAAADAVPGTYTETFTGLFGQVAIPRTATLLLTILQPPDFAIAVNPPTLPLAAGTSGTVTVSATGYNGFGGSIAVVAPALAGVTFTPSAFALAPGGSQTVGVQVALSAIQGTVMGTFTATAAGVTSPRTAALTLQITAPPDFALAVSPPALTVVGASSGSVSVSVTGLNGFAGTVNVTSPTVAGVTFVPASFALAPGGSQTVAINVPGTATGGTYAPQFVGTAAGVTGTRSAPLMLTVTPAPPVITTVTPPTFAVGAANMLLRLSGEYFRPGAIASSPDPALQVLRTRVISSTLAELQVTLASGARSGPYRLDLVNTDGTRTSQGVIVLAYPTTSVAAPLGVTTAAIVFPRPYTLAAPDAPLFPRGLLATTGLGAIVGSWRYDGVPFDVFVVTAAGGLPVEVKAHVPIPITYTGEHKLELAVEQPQALVTEPVSIIQTLETLSRLQILAPPDNAVFGEPAPLFRWSLVPGASGYEVEIERAEGRASIRVRLSESEWRPSARDVEEIREGVHRFRVRAIFPGETSGEPTPWRRFVIPPRNAELRMLPPASDPLTGRPVVRWEGGAPGLFYRVEFMQPGSGQPFASALTFRQRYVVPAGVAQTGAALQVRVLALAPDGSLRGTAAPAALRIESSLEGKGREFVLASAGAQVTGMIPLEGSTVAEDRPQIAVQWSGSVRPEEIVLTLDATDVTGVAALSEGSIAYVPLEPLAPGPHTLQISLAGAVTRSTFVVSPPPQVEAALASAPGSERRRDWQVAAMGNGTETSDQGNLHGDAGRLQLTGQGDIGSGDSEFKATADLGGRREFEPAYRTVSESRNWQFNLGAGQQRLKEEGRFGYSPPDFLDQSELLAAGLARGGAQAKLITPAGSISYYQTFVAESAGATGMPALAQDLKGIGFQAPWDPTRYLLRAVVLRSEGEVGTEQSGVRGEAAGVFGRFVLGTGVTLVFEGAYGKTRPQGEQSPPEQGGYGFHLGATGVLGTFIYGVNLRKTEAEFSNPLNTGLTYGAVPDRVSGDLSLSRQFGTATVSAQLRRLESGGGSSNAPNASEDGVMLNLAMPLRSNVNMSLAGTWAANKGDADPATYLPAVSRTQRGLTLMLTEVPGKIMLSQSLAWQEMLDDNMPAADQTVKSVTLSANGSLTQAVIVALLLSGTRSEGAPPVGTTDQVMLSLQPTFNWTAAFLNITPRAARIEVKSEMGGMKTTTDQFQLLTQLTPPWFGSLLAFQVAADWTRTRVSGQMPTPGFTRRIVGTCTLRWGAQRKPDIAPMAPVFPAAGASWTGRPSPTLSAAWL